MTVKVREQMLLKSHYDVFALKPGDMLGIYLGIIMHRLNVDPKARLVKQKKHKFSREKNEVIKAQEATLKEEKIVREIDNPTWLSNVLLVKKARGLPHICVAFIDLSDAGPEECFSMPNID